MQFAYQSGDVRGIILEIAVNEDDHLPARGHDPGIHGGTLA
nr:hypothetical protein [Verrucomicrobium spinosum]